MKFKIGPLIFLLAVFQILCSQLVFASVVEGSIDATDKYAWTENAGWLDFGTSQGNIVVGDIELTGYAWGENIGWVSLNCSNADSCSTVDYKVANDGEGNLSGYAWGENIGWINFDPTDGGVSINSSGEFSGYAWGENIGWIIFNCVTTNSCSEVNYKVATDWRPQSARPACNNSLDDDNDGLTDYPDDSGCDSLEDTDETDSVSLEEPSPPGKNMGQEKPKQKEEAKNEEKETIFNIDIGQNIINKLLKQVNKIQDFFNPKKEPEFSEPQAQQQKENRQIFPSEPTDLPKDIIPPVRGLNEEKREIIPKPANESVQKENELKEQEEQKKEKEQKTSFWKQLLNFFISFWKWASGFWSRIWRF